MRALLDVNVLIALLDSDHVHHALARRWLEANIADGWATCAITQNGCLRIMSQRNYDHSVSPGTVAMLFEESLATMHHEFWPDASILTPGVVDWNRVTRPKQITDVYLLALAAKNDGRLVTFDKRIDIATVMTANEETLFTIPIP